MGKNRREYEERKQMNKLETYSEPLMWFFALLLTASMAACGGGGSNNPRETVAPTVTSTAPADTATDVTINRKITATFSEAMDSTTIITPATTFTLTGPGTTPVSGTVSYAASGTAAIFTPAGDLATNTVFTATITTGAKDSAGNALASNFTWTFTTGTSIDTTAPTVTSTVPTSGATGVAINGNVTATFDEAMNPATITSSTFTLNKGTTPVSGAVSYAGTTAIFNPTANLATSTLYTATITTGVTDLAGNALAANMTWSFTTGTAVAKGPAPVVLGTAGNFVILSKSGITNVPTSVVTGDVGTSPISGSAIGLTCTEVIGVIYSVDAAGPPCRIIDPSRLTTAVSNMETAYTDAAGRTLPDFTELGAGNISGLTLVPGLYKWGTGVLIASNVTLSGGANDVWIFQIGQDLIVSNGVIITLSGDAQPKNIFWQVAGQATLGTTSNFKGVILSKTLIALQTGAVISGRTLAQTAVTLQKNTITEPAP